MATWSEFLVMGDPSTFEGISWAQGYEDILLERLFAEVGAEHRTLIDIGAGDGSNLSNTRRFIEHGWTGVRVDETASNDVRALWVMPSTIAAEMRELGAPLAPDLLSIDIDGQDWWVLDALLRSGVAPRVICAEYNACYADARSVPKDDWWRHDATTYYGASLMAFEQLLNDHGLRVIHQVHHRNLIAVRDDIAVTRAIDLDRTTRRWHTPYVGRRAWVHWS